MPSSPYRPAWLDQPESRRRRRAGSRHLGGEPAWSASTVVATTVVAARPGWARPGWPRRAVGRWGRAGAPGECPDRGSRSGRAWARCSTLPGPPRRGARSAARAGPAAGARQLRASGRGAAGPAGRMLSAAPGLRVLATSQLRLGVDGEAVYSLDPLAITDAVALFLRAGESAAAVVPNGEETDRVIEAVCRSLDGCRWPSSWPPRGSRRCRWRRSPDGSVIGSPCSTTRPATGPARSGPSGALGLELRPAVP